MKSVVTARWWLTFTLIAVFTVVALGVLIFLNVRQAEPTLGACPPSCPYTFRTPSTLSPASTEASSINFLFNLILILAGIVFVVVESLLLFTVFKYRNRPAEAALQLHGNTKLEVAWTAAPAVILAVVMGFTLRTMSEAKAPVPSDALKVTAIGHQFWWEFRYPNQKVVTASEMVVPLGTTVEVSVQSVDVEHGLWAPELFGKVDAIPGYTTRVRFTPTDTGRREYGGQCTQFCGVQHGEMRFSILTVSPSDFDAWVADQLKPAPTALTGDAAAGAQAFLEPQNACAACHAIGGTTAAGQVGPNLTHVGARSYIAGGILVNTPENLMRWLRDPQGVKPGSLMRIRQLDDKTIGDLAAYLTGLK